MKIFFNCKRYLSVVGEQHELESLRDALNDMLGDEEQVEVSFQSHRSARYPLVVTLYEDRFSGDPPTKKVICP